MRILRLGIFLENVKIQRLATKWLNFTLQCLNVKDLRTVCNEPTNDCKIRPWYLKVCEKHSMIFSPEISSTWHCDKNGTKLNEKKHDDGSILEEYTFSCLQGCESLTIMDELRNNQRKREPATPTYIRGSDIERRKESIRQEEPYDSIKYCMMDDTGPMDTYGLFI